RRVHRVVARDAAGTRRQFGEARLGEVDLFLRFRGHGCPHAAELICCCSDTTPTSFCGSVSRFHSPSSGGTSRKRRSGPMKSAVSMKGRTVRATQAMRSKRAGGDNGLFLT